MEIPISAMISIGKILSGSRVSGPRGPFLAHTRIGHRIDCHSSKAALEQYPEPLIDLRWAEVLLLS
jgi:hypothetical protein